MATDRADIPGNSGSLWWYRDYDRVLRGEQPLLWPTWAAPISTSKCLTPEGRQVAEWTVSVLQGFLGDDLLQRIMDAKVEHPLLSAALLASLWPIIDGRRVYVDLFRLAAHLALLGDRCLPVQKLLRNVANYSDWTHGLIQLDVAALALRNGWHTAFETLLDPTYRVDVRLGNGADTLHLEIASMGMAITEWEADQYFRRVSMTLLDIRLRHGVQVTGFVGDPAPDNVAMQWLQEIEQAAAAMAHDRRDRWVPGDVDGKVRVTLEELKSAETFLEGAPVVTNAWGRLDLRIQVKARQTANAGPVWLWLEDHAGLLLFPPLAPMSLAERLAVLAPLLRSAMELHPHLAGVLYTPGRILAPSTVQDETCEVSGFDGAVALRRMLPPVHARDIYLVARSGSPDAGLATFREWFDREATLLDWALEQLGKPPIDALVHEPVTATG